jgi:hypothetical protein
MILLLTILSVLALWALLGVLILGLLLILRPLQSVRGYLEKITMGVRAIEHQTLPLGARTDTLVGGLGELNATLRVAEGHLAGAGQHLNRAAPLLRPR